MYLLVYLWGLATPGSGSIFDPASVAMAAPPPKRTTTTLTTDAFVSSGEFEPPQWDARIPLRYRLNLAPIKPQTHAVYMNVRAYNAMIWSNVQSNQMTVPMIPIWKDVYGWRIGLTLP